MALGVIAVDEETIEVILSALSSQAFESQDGHGSDDKLAMAAEDRLILQLSKFGIGRLRGHRHTPAIDRFLESRP